MGIIAQILEQPDDRIAVEAGGHAISYARLKSDVDAAAARLRAEGVGPGKVVGIRAGPADNGHSYANWVVHLAVMKLGATHISMTDKAAIKASLQAMRVDLAVGTFESLIDVPLSVRRLEFHLDPAKPSEVAAPTSNDEASARRLNTTSGTTGKPKFVAWDADMMAQRVAQVADLVDAETRLFPILHLRTTAGFRYPLATWAAGGRVLLPLARSGVERDREAMPAATLLTCSPPQLKERLAQIPGEWPGQAGRTILLLGGRLPSVMRDEALARACSRLLISYGSTETGSIATGGHEVTERHPGAVGYVRPGVEVEIVGSNGEPVSPGQPGLLRARTGTMAGSYEEGQGAQTGGSGHFRDGWFYPGDVGRLYEDGLLAIDGRVGDVINLGGWKIRANDLEAKVGSLPGVRDVCAVSMQLPEGDMLTFGIVCDDDFDLRSFSERVHIILNRKRRFHVIRVPSIPRNAMGKIPRPLVAGQLAALYRAVKKNAANA
jgi:acyl-CoA synthetase (AMP-forming)/AMP-acid ligase II